MNEDFSVIGGGCAYGETNFWKTAPMNDERLFGLAIRGRFDAELLRCARSDVAYRRASICRERIVIVVRWAECLLIFRRFRLRRLGGCDRFGGTTTLSAWTAIGCGIAVRGAWLAARPSIGSIGFAHALVILPFRCADRFRNTCFGAAAACFARRCGFLHDGQRGCLALV